MSKIYVDAVCSCCGATDKIVWNCAESRHWDCPQNGQWVMGNEVHDNHTVMGQCSKCGEKARFSKSYRGEMVHNACLAGGAWVPAVDLAQWHLEYESRENKPIQTWTRRPFGDDFVVLHAFEPRGTRSAMASLSIPCPSDYAGFEREGDTPATGSGWNQKTDTVEEAKQAADKAFADRDLVNLVFWPEIANSYGFMAKSVLPVLEKLLKLLPDSTPLSRDAWEIIDLARAEASEARRRMTYVDDMNLRKSQSFSKPD